MSAESASQRNQISGVKRKKLQKKSFQSSSCFSSFRPTRNISKSITLAQLPGHGSFPSVPSSRSPVVVVVVGVASPPWLAEKRVCAGISAGSRLCFGGWRCEGGDGA